MRTIDNIKRLISNKIAPIKKVPAIPLLLKLVLLLVAFYIPCVSAQQITVEPRYLYQALTSGFRPFFITKEEARIEFIAGRIRDYGHIYDYGEEIFPDPENRQTLNGMPLYWSMRAWPAPAHPYYPGPIGISGGIILTASCPVGYGYSEHYSSGAYSYVCYSNTPPPCNTCEIGNPIQVSSGVKIQRETDYQSPNGLRFEREYRGNNWTHNYKTAGIDIAGATPAARNALFSKLSCIPGIDQKLNQPYCFRPVNASYGGTAGALANEFFIQRGQNQILKFGNASNLNPAADINDRITKITDGSGQVTGWSAYNASNDATDYFDLLGNLQRTVQRNGEQQIMTYSDGATPASIAPAPGLLVRVTDSYGRELNFTYDHQSRMTSMTNPEGGITTYAYDEASSIVLPGNLPAGNLTTVTYPDGKQKIYWYNEQDKTSGKNFPNALTGITDENSARYATYKYNTDGKAISTEHANGIDKYSFAYISDRTEVTDPLGTLYKYNFESHLNTTKVSNITRVASGVSTNRLNRFDANGNTTEMWDFKGTKTCHAYDLSRNLETARVEGLASGTNCSTALAASTQTAPARKITTTWHATYRLPLTIIEPITGGTKVVTNTYDASGNLTTQSTATPSGTRTRNWTYDALGRVLTATDALNHTTTYTYYPNTPAQNISLPNSRGQLATITNAAGHVTQITSYNPHGQPLTLIDLNGLVSMLTYDPRQRLTSRTIGSETTTYTYDGAGQLTRVTLPDNSYLNYTHDDAHRLIAITDSLGNKLTYTLDAIGNRIAENTYDPSNALARTKSRVYDALNRLQKDIGGSTPGSDITQYAYDPNGNPTSVTDPLSRITSQTYDTLNRLLQIIDPINGASKPTKYEYDPQDNLTKVTDPKNIATTYTYNGFNELITQISPDTGTTSYTYDAAGNLTSKTDARGITATYGYDALNRLTSINYPAVGSDPAETVTYRYDSAAGGDPACSNALGRLCKITDKTGSTGYTYNPMGRLTAKSQTSGSLTQTVSYRYNSAGQLNTLTLPSGKIITYTYNHNRLIGITADGQTVIKNADYEPFGPIAQWTWGNDSLSAPNQHNRYYDLDGRPTHIENANNLNANQINYDIAGRITALQKMTTPAGTTIDTTQSASYGYDNLDRLTGVTPGSGNPIPSQGYTYDEIGNRLTHTLGGSSTTYSYPATNHRLQTLTGANAKTYTYDAAGNRINDGTTTWSYGGNNRPTQVSQTSGSGTTNTLYAINALGQRIQKTTPAAGGGGGGGSTPNVTRFLYDEAGHLIGEYDNDGQPIQETIWLNDLPVGVLK